MSPALIQSKMTYLCTFIQVLAIRFQIVIPKLEVG